MNQKITFFRKSCLLALFSFLVLPVFAEQSIDAVFVQMNLAFAEKSSGKISEILKNNTSSSDYKQLEAYTLKKTRQLIIEDDLEFARQSALAVIDNNLENFDAVELYSYIDRAILNEKAAKQAEENRLRLEAERRAVLAEKTKQKIEKSDSYQTISTNEGSSVYIRERESSFSTIDWNIQIGMGDFLYQTITPENYNSLKYGLGFGADIFYNMEGFVLGADIFADFHMLTLNGGEQEFFIGGRFIPMMAFSNFNRKLFFRMGVAAYGAKLGENKKEDIIPTPTISSFFTPVFGIGLENLSIKNFDFNLHADYYMGHFAYDDINLSFEVGGGVTIPVSINEKTKIGLKLGASDLIFLKNDGMENRLKGIIAIGVGNVIK